MMTDRYRVLVENPLKTALQIGLCSGRSEEPSELETPIAKAFHSAESFFKVVWAMISSQRSCLIK